MIETVDQRRRRKFIVGVLDQLAGTLGGAAAGVFVAGAVGPVVAAAAGTVVVAAERLPALIFDGGRFRCSARLWGRAPEGSG